MNIGVSWFQPEQWDRLKEISEDRDELDDTYEDWRRNANKAVQEIRSTGRVVKKVSIDLEELLIWCNENNLAVNGKSRAEYVSRKLCSK